MTETFKIIILAIFEQDDFSNKAMVDIHGKPIPQQVSQTRRITEYRCYIEINAYHAGLLRIYQNLPQSELDQSENIEELKLLYNGMKMHAAEANSLIGQRVVSAEDVEKVKIQITPNR